MSKKDPLKEFIAGGFGGQCFINIQKSFSTIYSFVSIKVPVWF